MKAKNQKISEGSFSTSNVFDICFPVQMLESETEYIDSVKNNIFVYPYKVTNFVEMPNVMNTQLQNSQIELPERSNVQTEMPVMPELFEQLFEQIENVEATELMPVINYDQTRPIKVNSCSDRYKLIPNSDIFPVIENILNKANIRFSVTYTITDYSMVYATYTIEDERFKFQVAKGDIVKVQITVWHSYNGLRKYRINISFMRLVCLNGLTVAAKDMKEYSLDIVGKHTENIVQSFQKLNQALENLQNADFVKAIANKYLLLNTVKVSNLPEAIEKVLKVANINAIETKNFNTVTNIQNRITDEIRNNSLDTVITNWNLYNGINAYIYDKDLRIATPEIRLKSDQLVFEYLIKDLK